MFMRKRPEDKRSIEEIGKRGRAGLLKFPTYHAVG
jgi:hypothetical protein